MTDATFNFEAELEAGRGAMLIEPFEVQYTQALKKYLRQGRNS